MLWRAFAMLAHGARRVGLRPAAVPPPSRLCQNPEQVLRTFERVDEAIWSSQALIACAQSGLIAYLDRPTTISSLATSLDLPQEIVHNLVGVLAGFGLVTIDGDRILAAPGFLPFTGQQGAPVFDGAVRAPLLQAEHFRKHLAERTLNLEGWTHTDPAVIEAQGILTRLWTKAAIAKLRYLPGLAERLNRGGALLDVGAGAAGLSITLCQAFPALTATALEPASAPAAIGEHQIRSAGLGDRIKLRRQRVEEIEDVAAFDLVFLPQMFLPDAVIDPALAALFRAMRPGAWVLVPVMARRGQDLPSAIARLKTLLWGGNARDVDMVAERLAAAGFAPVIRAPGRQAIRMICARRPFHATLATLK
ncbi:SAM-dependent methyltransferase [Microvirga antarctica]|uniref:SAM-dependent methyltransferase n=1 Tax=Microvirga antarctica TaxID=2819233 RepID=UPI001B3043B0|nr:class I SAM-dependent methyltransferase [Microvirga antarctica]